MKNDISLNSKEFFKAVEEGDVETVSSLLETGIDPNLENKDGDTALHLASYKGHPKVVKFLLKSGTNIKRKSS